MFFRIQISTKNKKSLKNFLIAVSKLKLSNLLIKSSSKEMIKSFVTVLKSPHVNKSAQEQFEFRIFSKTLFLSSSQPMLDLVAIKTIKNSSFSGLKLKISIIHNQKKKLKDSYEKLNPDNSRLKSIKNSSNYKEFEHYIKSFDNYGEFCVKKLLLKSSCIFSSVG